MFHLLLRRADAYDDIFADAAICRSLKEFQRLYTGIVLEARHEEDALLAVMIERGVINIASIKYIGDIRLIDKFIKLRAVILLGICDGCLLRNGVLFTDKRKSHVDFHARLRFSKVRPFVLL
ncbi:hypothetical protein D3C84_574510 [compost metagenome]